jgi:hypothetical protein
VSGGRQHRDELILNVTVSVVRVWGGQYREQLILSITAFFVRVWQREIKRGKDSECYWVSCEGLGRRK